MKNCNKCYQTKKPSDFYKKRNGEPCTICKECKLAWQRAWHHKKSKDVVWRAKRSEKNKIRYYEKIRQVHGNKVGTRQVDSPS